MAEPQEIQEEEAEGEKEGDEELPLSAPHPSEFESIDLALEEFRRLYDDEERRREALDKKLNFILGFNALLLTLTIGIFDLLGRGVVLVLLFLVVSTFIVFQGIHLKNYERPFEKVGHIYSFADAPKRDFEGEVSELYEECIRHNMDENNDKQTSFWWGAVFTIASLIMIGISVAVPYSIL